MLRAQGRISFIRLPKGDNAKQYSLLPSVNIVKKSMAGVLTPSKVSCQKMVSNGGVPVVCTESTIVIKYQLSTMASASIYSSDIALTSTVDWCEFTLWSGTTLLDLQRVQVLSDASDMEIGGRNLLLNSGTHVTNNLYNINSYDFGEIKPVVDKTYTIVLNGQLGEGKTEFKIYNSGSLVSVISIYSSDFINGIAKKTFKWRNTVNGVTATDTHIKIYTVPSTVTVDSTINWIKLVEGNTTSNDWTPAPEDAKTYTDAQFKVLSDRITTKVETSTYDNNNTVIANRFTQVEQTSAQIQSTVSSNKTDADGKISNLQTQITQNAESISLKVSKGDTLGGRNYVANGDRQYYSDSSWVNDDDWNRRLTKPYSYFSGKKITMSFDYVYTDYVYSSANNNRLAFTIRYDTDKYLLCSITLNASSPKSGSGRVSATYQIPATSLDNKECFTSKSMIANVSMKNLQLEIGEVATDFKTAPEDVDDDINAVQSNVNSVQTAINNMNNDTIFDISEKQTIRIEWEKICGGKFTTGYPTAGSYGKALTLANNGNVATSALSSKFNLLRNYLITTNQLYSDVNTSNFNRTTLAQYFTNYYQEETNIYDALSQRYGDYPNLLPGTNKGAIGWSQTSENSNIQFEAMANGGVKVKMATSPGAWANVFWNISDLKQLVAGETYTLTFKTQCQKNCNLTVQLCDTDGNNELASSNTIYSDMDAEQEVTCRFTINSTAKANQKLRIYGFKDNIDTTITNGSYQWFTVRDLMLVKGKNSKPYKPAIVDDTGKKLLDTGVDIENRKITITSDTFLVQNNSGDRTALVTSDGKLDVDLIDTKKITTNQMVCMQIIDGTPYMISSINSRGDGMMCYYYDNGQPSKRDVPIYDQRQITNSDGTQRLITEVVGVKTVYYDRDGTIVREIGVNDGSFIDNTPVSPTYTYAWGYRTGLICWKSDGVKSPDEWLSANIVKCRNSSALSVIFQTAGADKVYTNGEASECTTNNAYYNGTMVYNHNLSSVTTMCPDLYLSSLFTGIIFNENEGTLIDAAEKRYRRIYTKYNNGNPSGPDYIDWQE